MSNGGSVFPKFGEHEISEGGMSLRDWFASQALAGLASDGQAISQIAREGADPAAVTARTAYAMADAMLAEREK